jgi:hypothetical protein
MGCNTDSVASDALYWCSRGIDSETGRYTCCGTDALGDSRHHAWNCPRVEQIRAGKIPTS